MLPVAVSPAVCICIPPRGGGRDARPPQGRIGSRLPFQPFQPPGWAAGAALGIWAGGGAGPAGEQSSLGGGKSPSWGPHMRRGTWALKSEHLETWVTCMSSEAPVCPATRALFWGGEAGGGDCAGQPCSGGPRCQVSCCWHGARITHCRSSKLVLWHWGGPFAAPQSSACFLGENGWVGSAHPAPYLAPKVNLL